MDIIAPISEVRGSLPLFLNKMRKSNKHLIITKNGKAVAVVVTPEEMETLEISSDTGLMKSILRALQNQKDKKLYSHKDVFGGRNCHHHIIGRASKKCL